MCRDRVAGGPLTLEDQLDPGIVEVLAHHQEPLEAAGPGDRPAVPGGVVGGLSLLVEDQRLGWDPQGAGPPGHGPRLAEAAGLDPPTQDEAAHPPLAEELHSRREAVLERI